MARFLWMRKSFIKNNIKLRNGFPLRSFAWQKEIVGATIGRPELFISARSD